MRPFPKVLSRVTEITMSLAYLTYWGAVDVAAPPVMYKTVHLLKMHTDLRPIWKYILGNLPFNYLIHQNIWNLQFKYFIFCTRCVCSCRKHVIHHEKSATQSPFLRVCAYIQNILAFSIWLLYINFIKRNSADHISKYGAYVAYIWTRTMQVRVLSSLSIQNTLFPMGILIKSLPYFSWVSCNFVYCLY